MKARADREALRFAAAERFERGVDAGEIACEFAVTRKSVNEWKRAWRDGGIEALASKGPGGATCRLDDVRLKTLEQVLDEGPAARGWREDQRWTLARIATVIWELFKVRYTLRGVSLLLHRIGWRPQVPQHVAAERNETQVATWVRETWPQVIRTAARLRAWILFEDEAGQSLRPPKARTWSRRGHPPRVRVSGKGSGRVNLAGMLAVRAGCRPRLIYRVLPNHGRRGEKKGFRERDLAGMLDAAHQQLGRAPLVVVWDNDTAHRDTAMRVLLADRPWLTVFYLPAYTPTLNPVEGVWSALKRSLANLAPRGTDALAALVKTRLRRMQYRTDGLLDGFLAETGLTLEPP